MLVSNKALKSLELQISLELRNIKEWCDINKLSINLKRANYMIVKPQRKKKNNNIIININNTKGSCHALDCKYSIKYLGISIDSHLTWNYHMSSLCSKVSRIQE